MDGWVAGFGFGFGPILLRWPGEASLASLAPMVQQPPVGLNTPACSMVQLSVFCLGTIQIVVSLVKVDFWIHANGLPVCRLPLLSCALLRGVQSKEEP